MYIYTYISLCLYDIEHSFVFRKPTLTRIYIYIYIYIHTHLYEASCNTAVQRQVLFRSSILVNPDNIALVCDENLYI